MPNAIVRAAATGLSSLSRRSFLTSATAVAVALPVAAVAPEPDPIYAAIAKAAEANRVFEATLTELSAAQSAVLSLGLGFSPHVTYADVSLGSHDDIRTAFDIERLRFPLSSEKLTAAENRLHAEFDRRASAIRVVEIEHGLDDLKRREDTESAAAIAAEIEALSTVPATLSGMTALAEFMCLQRIAESDHAMLGARSLAVACRNLIPA